MNDIEIGQILSFKIRFNNSGSVACNNHPYLVVDFDVDMNIIEIAQLDSLKGKEYKAAKRTNKNIEGKKTN